MNKKFIKKDLEFYLPENFNGISKNYILSTIFDSEIQNSWKPAVGNLIVGRTGNIFVISAKSELVKELGGTTFLFAGDFCNRDGGNIMNSTYSSVLNEDGLEYYYDAEDYYKIKTRENCYYNKFSDYRWVPYPHELIIGKYKEYDYL